MPFQLWMVGNVSSTLHPFCLSIGFTAGDIGSLALTVPSVRKEWKYLVVTVIRCEDLPIMDGKVGKGKGGRIGGRRVGDKGVLTSE